MSRFVSRGPFKTADAVIMTRITHRHDAECIPFLSNVLIHQAPELHAVVPPLHCLMTNGLPSP
jgi:hypothetical protein